MLLSWKVHTVIGGVEMSDEKLKPCPFCGGEAREVIRKGVFSERFSIIYCTKCEHSSGLFKGIKSAREYWNTRPLEDEKDKELKEQKKLMKKKCYDCLDAATGYYRKKLIENELKGIDND